MVVEDITQQGHTSKATGEKILGPATHTTELVIIFSPQRWIKQ